MESKLTRILTSCETELSLAVQDLKSENPVAIPTETVYGLAANALSPLACSRIFQVKNRPTDNPLICHISSMEMLDVLVAKDAQGKLLIPEQFKPVLEKFWPGPLTVLLPKCDAVPDIVSAGLETVGIRFPSHPVARRIIELCNFPLAAPSANLSGRPSPTTAQHVMHDLDGRISFIVDGGSSDFGLESTVLDATSSPPIILRPGAITASMLRPYIPDVQVYGQTSRNLALEDRPPTPGMKYKHYAPSASVISFKPGSELEERIQKFLKEHMRKKFVRLCLQERPRYDNVENYCLSRGADLLEVARNLFSGLRDADLRMPDFILAEEVVEDDEGLAIMNRLCKASSLRL